MFVVDHRLNQLVEYLPVAAMRIGCTTSEDCVIKGGNRGVDPTGPDERMRL
jgi:hypothetical protein